MLKSFARRRLDCRFGLPRSPAAELDVTKLNTKIDALAIQDAASKLFTAGRQGDGNRVPVVRLSGVDVVRRSAVGPREGVCRSGRDICRPVPVRRVGRRGRKAGEGISHRLPGLQGRALAAADALKAATTPEVFVLDRIRSYATAAGSIRLLRPVKKNPQVTSQDLRTRSMTCSPASRFASRPRHRSVARSYARNR